MANFGRDITKDNAAQIYEETRQREYFAESNFVTSAATAAAQGVAPHLYPVCRRNPPFAFGAIVALAVSEEEAKELARLLNLAHDVEQKFGKIVDGKITK